MPKFPTADTPYPSAERFSIFFPPAVERALQLQALYLVVYQVFAIFRVAHLSHLFFCPPCS